MAKSFNAQMKERFTRITAGYDKVNNLVHETAMMIFDHAKEHGDCSSAQGLVMALPASMRREMLILWFAKYTPIVVKNSDDWNAKMHPKDSKLFVEWNREDADANPFHVLAKENKERPPLNDDDILKLISGLAGRLEKQMEEGKIAATAKDAAQAVVAQLRKIKVPAKRPANTNSKTKVPAKRPANTNSKTKVPAKRPANTNSKTKAATKAA